MLHHPSVKQKEKEQFQRCKSNKIELELGQNKFYFNPDLKREANWLKGKIVKQISNILCLVEVNTRRRVAHRNQLKAAEKHIVLPITSQINDVQTFERKIEDTNSSTLQVVIGFKTN